MDSCDIKKIWFVFLKVLVNFRLCAYMFSLSCVCMCVRVCVEVCVCVNVPLEFRGRHQIPLEIESQLVASDTQSIMAL